MKRSFLVFYCILMILNYESAQDLDSPTSKHEKWEFILEDVGDISQIALPLSAGIMTLIKRDYEGTKKFVFSYSTSLAITYSLKHIVRKPRP